MPFQNVVYVHDDRFDLYDFGAAHLFTPLRQRLTADLLQECGLLPKASVAAADAATIEELLLFHTREYVEAVWAQGGGSPLRWGLGTRDNPIFPEMHLAAAVRVGATLKAVREVVSGRAVRAANFGGGLHHALADKASGFCIYNDIAVSIAWLRRKFDLKVAYVDLDVHHGDGVQWAFYDDPGVLTVSLHESGRYLFPGTGDVGELGSGAALGTSVNVPLLPGTSGESWLECFEIVVPAVLEAFRPDLLITQHGCDAHRLDPLAHLSVSTQSMAKAARILRGLADELCGGRWVALGGGGYSIWDVVPRAWSAVWAEVCGVPLPAEVPAGWRARWQELAPAELPTEWHDAVEEPPAKDGADIESEWRREQNRRTAIEALSAAARYLPVRRR